MAREMVLNIGIVIAVGFLLVGCDGLWPDTCWRSERYVLLAVDTSGQMSLSFDLGDGTCMRLVGATVYSIGANDKYIVVKQHPSTDDFGGFDQATTRYFIVERTASPSFADRQKGVRGPLTKEEFEKQAGSLSLPNFSRTFDDLK